MRIGVLAKGGTDWIGGLHYTFNLIRALRALPTADQPEITLLVPGEGRTEHFREVSDLADMRAVPQSLPDGRRVGEMNPALERIIADDGIDAVFPCMRSMGPAFPCAWLPWIPDLQHRSHREFFSAEECAIRDRDYKRIAEDARLVVLSSRSAADDFTRFRPDDAGKFRVLHFATVPLPQWHQANARDSIRDLDLPDRYLMLPNQFWMHKNHRTAFEAMKILTDRGVDVRLVCTGHPQDPRRPNHARRLREFIDDQHLSERIRILGLLPRQTQIQVMRAASAVVQPSLFEGWSTVVEDARVFGKRLFLSDIPVHREQQPAGAVYFDPLDAEALADRIAESWPGLADAPNPEEESAALTAQQQRVRTYAEDFLDIAHELLDVPASTSATSSAG